MLKCEQNLHFIIYEQEKQRSTFFEPAKMEVLKIFTGKLLHQGYRYHKLRKTFSKFYRRHNELGSKFKVGLKFLLQKGLSEPEFHGKLIRIVSRTDFSDLFRKVIMRYKRI